MSSGRELFDQEGNLTWYLANTALRLVARRSPFRARVQA